MLHRSASQILLACIVVFFVFTGIANAQPKQNLVLLPIDVTEAEDHLKSLYEAALVESLSKKYTVFYGAKVEQKLKKEYDKIDCSPEQCIQNVAISFNGELVADAAVVPLGTNGYVLKLKITNVVDDQIVESKALPCRGCDQFVVISKLQSILNGNGGNSGSSTSVVSTPSASSSVERVGSQSTQMQSDARAILIFDSKPSGADVYINDQLKGKTPYQGLSHMIGDQLNIKVKEPSHRTYEFNVSLNQAITQLDPVNLEMGQGKLTVLTEPFTADAIVYVDGKAIGPAPVQIDLTTKPHEIYANANGKKTKVEQVQLKDGESQQLVLPFSTTSPLLAQMGIELADIPAGSFMMGSNNGNGNEKPVHRVTVPAFKMMKHEVTWLQYQPCIDAGVCGDNTSNGGDNGWGKGNRPVIEVSWNDAQDYIRWLNQKTGMNFRLPSEAEWEYAARAGSTTQYSWGNTIGSNRANCNDCGSSWDYLKTAPVGSFQSNEFGLYDMHGNVWEWTQDCSNGSYSGAPNNGAAWESGNCDKRVRRGGGWFVEPSALRSAYRVGSSALQRYSNVGFRLVQDL
jgi:formylglycine-generating enzyme required for sulfatase activity